MADDERSKELKAAVAKAFAKPFGAILEIAPDGAAPFFIDGRADPPAIIEKTPKGAKADCALRGAADVLVRVLGGERALESAYVSGGICISGDMSVMARLAVEPAR